HHTEATARPRLQAPPGPLLSLLRAVARPVRALLRPGAGPRALPPLRRAPGPHRPDSAVRLAPRAPLRHQRHRLRARGVPARGGQALVGPLVAGRMGAGAALPGARAGGGGAPRPPPRDLALPLHDLVRVHRADPALLLRPPDHDAA